MKTPFPWLEEHNSDKGIIAITTFFQNPKPPFTHPMKSLYALKNLQSHFMSWCELYSREYSHLGFEMSGQNCKFFVSDLMHFRVKDTGIGIKPQDATELFSKFVRGSGIAQIHPDGSGLGLFIAKSIIDAHGGKIWTESEGEGQGSTFQFTLPLKPPMNLEVQPLNAAAHVVKPKGDIKTLKDE